MEPSRRLDPLKALADEKIHEETSRAWDVVAQAKYDAELEEHLQLLRSLGHTVLPVEIEAVQPYLAGAKVVHTSTPEGCGTREVRDFRMFRRLEHPLGLRWLRGHEHPLLFWDQFPRWPKQLRARLPHSYSIMAVREEDKRE